MASKSIKNANKGNIVFLSNNNYDQLYSSILFALGKNAPFAPLTIQGSNLTWKAEKPGDYKSITDAPEEIIGKLGMLWEQTKKELQPKLAEHDIDFVLEIPDYSYVFYTEDLSGDDAVLNNRYKLLITGWACQKGSIQMNDGDDGMTTRIHEAQNKLQNVIARMIDENEMPIANGDFIYTFGDNIAKNEKTDTEGIINTGVCVVGSALTYTYSKTGQSKTITVQKNIENYTITFAPTTDIHVKVVNQHNEPLQAHKVKISYGTRSFLKDTDGLGNISVGNILYTNPSLQVTVAVDGFGEESFPVTCPQCNIVMRVQVKEQINPTLRVVREGNPVAGHPISFTGKVIGTYASNDEGLIFFQDLQVGDSFVAKSALETGALPKNYTIIEEKSEYIYELPPIIIEKPEPTEPPMPQNRYIKVINKTDGKPVPNYSLHFESSTMNGIRLSDGNGIIPLENVKDGDALKIFTSNTNEPTIINIEKDKNEYIIYVGDIKEEKQNCHVKVIDESGKIVSGLSVKVETDSSNGYVTSDENGKIELGELTVGSEIKCNVPAENQTLSFIVEKNKEEYLIIITQKPEAKTIDCHIKVVEGVEQIPVGNYSLRIESEAMQGYFLTDTYGTLPLEKMEVGMKVSCYVSQELPPVVFDIVEGKEEYLIQIDKRHDVLEGDIMVSLVENDKKTPVFPATITLTNKKGEKFIQQNDYRGCIVVPKTFFNDNEKIQFHADINNKSVRDCKFRYTKECDHYVIYLTNPRSWKWLLWLLLLPLLLLLSVVRCERDITVHTIDGKGNNVSNIMVQLKYTEHAIYKEGQFFLNIPHKYQAMTNEEGFHTFKDTPCSVYSYIFYCLQKGLAIGKRNAEYGGSTSFFYNWQNKVDIVITRSKMIQVKSSKTGKPIAQAQVDINKDKVDVIDSTMITDENGCCKILQNFEKPITKLRQLTATKTGYSGARLKNIEFELDDGNPLVVYLDEPEPCKDQGENNNDRQQGNFAMRDYDMKKSGGEFIFKYYTDTAADKITIYDGSSSDYVRGSASTIFNYDGATCTRSFKHFESVKFSTRYICVVVEGGTNWGYVVDCPHA